MALRIFYLRRSHLSDAHCPDLGAKLQGMHGQVAGTGQNSMRAARTSHVSD